MAKDNFNKPVFIIDPDDTNAELRLHALEDELNKDPLLYQEKLQSLGALATAGTVDYAHYGEQPEADELPSDPEGRILEFFKYRYDKTLTYDDATESALDENASWRELLEKQRATRNVSKKIGVQTSIRVENENAVPTRDQMRIMRLGFFINRLAEWQQSQASAKRRNKKLPSAS